MGFFKSIPRELEDAALVDGASRLARARPHRLPDLAAGDPDRRDLLRSRSVVNEFVYAITFITHVRPKAISTGVRTELIRGDVFYWGALMAATLIPASRSRCSTTCSSTASSPGSPAAHSVEQVRPTKGDPDGRTTPGPLTGPDEEVAGGRVTRDVEILDEQGRLRGRLGDRARLRRTRRRRPPSPASRSSATRSWRERSGSSSGATSSRPTTSGSTTRTSSAGARRTTPRCSSTTSTWPTSRRGRPPRSPRRAATTSSSSSRRRPRTRTRSIDHERTSSRRSRRSVGQMKQGRAEGDVQPEDEEVLRLLRQLRPRPGPLPDATSGARSGCKPTTWDNVRKAAPKLQGDGPPDRHRHVERARLEHGPDRDHAVLRRLHPERGPARRPQHEGDASRS